MLLLLMAELVKTERKYHVELLVDLFGGRKHLGKEEEEEESDKYNMFQNRKRKKTDKTKTIYKNKRCNQPRRLCFRRPSSLMALY